MNPMNNKRLVSKKFLFEDITNFANLSGDWNPFHINKTFARRLASGEIVVHGISSFLWGLEEVIKEINQIPSAIRCNFLKPVLENEEIFTELDGTDELSTKFLIRSKSEIKVFIEVTLNGQTNEKDFQSSEFDIASPLNNSFEELKDLSGVLNVSGNSELFSKSWPTLTKKLGVLPVASIINLSRLVGMYCPGQNSIFSSMDFELNQNHNHSNINWNGKSHSHKVAPIRIDIAGAGIKGNLEVFYRPVPINQESMDLISSKISDLDFSDQTALIIGGSRGLGETVSKIISASGGKVVLTYYKGKEDAQDLMNEINKYKNSCSILGLNVLNEEEVKKNLGILIDEVDMIFYFASPKIKLSDDRNSLDLMDLYRDFYVNGFKEVVKVF